MVDLIDLDDLFARAAERVGLDEDTMRIIIISMSLAALILITLFVYRTYPPRLDKFQVDEITFETADGAEVTFKRINGHEWKEMSRHEPEVGFVRPQFHEMTPAEADETDRRRKLAAHEATPYVIEANEVRGNTINLGVLTGSMATNFTPNTNPLWLDSLGQTEGIYLLPHQPYTLILGKPGNGNLCAGTSVGAEEWKLDDVIDNGTLSVVFPPGFKSPSLTGGKTQFFTKDGQLAKWYYLCTYVSGTRIPLSTFRHVPQ